MLTRCRAFASVSLVVWLSACSGGGGARRPAAAAARGHCQRGEISFYAAKFEGRKTASGERYHHEEMTAAHRTLPFGTRVSVAVGRARVHVRVNDRGPFARHRILDVSGRAARELGLIQRGHGTAEVCVD